MKLNSRQIIGLGAIVIFGGMMIFRLTQPSEKEIMERRLASLPSVTAPSGALDFPMPDLPALTAPIPPVSALDDLPAATTPPPEAEPDYAAMGSQAAKDDIYCSGVLREHFNTVIKTEGVDRAGDILELSRLLTGAGIAKLRAENITHAQDIGWVDFDNAHADKGIADYQAKTPRISAAACEARGKALPADTPKLP